MKIKITDNIKRVLTDIVRLEGGIKQEVEMGAEKAIQIQLNKLKAEIKHIFNNTVTDPASNNKNIPQPLAQKIAEEQLFGRNKYLGFEGSFETSMESPIIKAHMVNTGSGNLVSKVRQETGDKTYEDHLSEFKSSLLDKTFAIQGRDGNYRYYVIPKGSTLEHEVLEDVKIFCSSFTDSAGQGRGDDEFTEEGEPLLNIGRTKGKQKFERDKARRGYTDFTLKERAFKAIAEKGIDVTEMTKGTQYGRYDDVRDIAKSLKDERTKQIASATEKMMSDPNNLTKQAQALGKSNKAIDGIRVKKDKYDGNTVGYHITILTTNEQLYLDDSGGSSDSKWNLGTGAITGGIDAFPTKKSALESQSQGLLNALSREAKVWAKESEGIITAAIKMAIQQAIKDFNKK